MGAEPGVAVPPVVEDGFVLPRFLKPSLPGLLAQLPAQKRSGIDVRRATVVLRSVVLEEG